MFVELLKDFLGQKTGTRLDVSEADAKGMVSAGTAKECPDDLIGKAVSEAMAKAMEGISGAMGKAVDAALKDFSQASQKSRRHGVPAIFGEGGSGDPNRTFGAFLLAVRSRDYVKLEEFGSRLVEWDGDTSVKAAMNTTTGTQGGFTVPTDHFGRLMALATDMSVVRKRATVVPMSAREVEIPAIDYTTAPSAGDTAFLGGLVARWTEEGGDKNQTEPTFTNRVVKNYELSGYSKVSNALLADNAVGLEAFLMTLFARAIAWYEDYAFLRGNGVGKPLGPVLWAGLISASRSAASAFALDDAAEMISRLLPGYDGRHACWAIHPTVIHKLFQIVSSGGSFGFLTDVKDTPRMTLLGLPVEVTEKLPTLNTAGDILLGDWQHYVIGDRQQVEIAFSEHAAFTTNQTIWRFVSRVGGLPWLKDKVTLSDASSTLSPFVALAAG